MAKLIMITVDGQTQEASSEEKSKLTRGCVTYSGSALIVPEQWKLD